MTRSQDRDLRVLGVGPRSSRSDRREWRRELRQPGVRLDVTTRKKEGHCPETRPGTRSATPVLWRFPLIGPSLS